MYCKEAWMDMQIRILGLGDMLNMDMAHQLDRQKPKGKMVFKEKEMEPKFKVGDKVVTPKGKWGEVIAVGLFVTVKLRESRLSTGTFNLTTHNELWKHSQLRLVNIYDEAGERWRSACAMKRLRGIMNSPYTGPVAPLRNRELWTKEVVDRFEEYCGSRSDKLTSEMEEKLNETESELRIGDIVENRIGERGRVVKISKRVFVYVKMLTGARESRTLCFDKKGLVKLASKEKAVREAYQEPPQPIFRMRKKDGTSGWEGCYFVLVAEDEREMLLKGVDINEAKVEDRVVNAQKSTWTRDYSIGDEIINFLSARGGNFTNKLVDKS